jgi:tetratricopeptide (TPR) repeat protein
MGDYDDAQSFLEEGQSIWLQLGPSGKRGLAEALIHRGLIVLLVERDMNKAEALFSQSADLCQSSGDRQGLATSLIYLSHCANHLNHAQALAYGNQSLELFNQIGDWCGIAMSSQYLGQLHLKQADYEIAAQLFNRDLEINQRLKYKVGILVALRNLGDLYRSQGDYDRAEQLYLQCLIPCKEIGVKKDLISILYLLAMVALHRDEYALARQRFIEYFDVARPIFERTSLGDLFSGMAAVAAGTNQLERSARLRGAVQKILDQEDYLWAHERREFNRLIPRVRQQLGETAFEIFAAEGYALTTAEAVAYALAG